MRAYNWSKSIYHNVGILQYWQNSRFDFVNTSLTLFSLFDLASADPPQTVPPTTQEPGNYIIKGYYMTIIPFKVLLWLIQQWSSIVFLCHLYFSALQRDKLLTHYYFKLYFVGWIPYMVLKNFSSKVNKWSVFAEHS